MSTVSEYIKKERELKRIQAEMRAMEMSTDIAQERSFREQLSALMRKYGKTSADLLEIASPYETKKNGRSGPRKAIKRTYKNPMTGEIMDHFGGRYPVLMQKWVDQYGKEVVKSWKVSENGVNVGRYDPIIPEGKKARPDLHVVPDAVVEEKKEPESPEPLDITGVISPFMNNDTISHSSFYA